MATKNELNQDAPKSWKLSKTTIAVVTLALAAGVVGGGYAAFKEPPKEAESPEAVAGKVDKDLVRIAPDQLEALQVGPGESKAFDHVRQTIGVIDFNQDRTTRVYSAYQGRVSKVLVKAGDDVKAGQVLFTVAVPDMSSAASTLISTSATLHNANETLKRATALSADSSIAQKELQQAQSDQQTAQAAYDAARQNLKLFELGDADISRIEKTRSVGLEFSVKSPMAGRVTSRSAQPGSLVQPGNDPAPMVVSDMRSLWMVANVPESDFSHYKVGQPVNVRVSAWPGRTFSGKVSYVGDSVDADSRRFVVRAEVADPQHELRPQMSADFSVTVNQPDQSLAVPAQAVVREGNGSDVVWVATGKDSKGPLFTRRAVKRGETSGGWVQVDSGLAANESVARSNALFLSSLYETNAQ